MRGFRLFSGCWVVALLFGIGSCNKNRSEENEDGQKKAPEVVISVLASGLHFPWGLAYLPNGDLLFTERPGNFYVLKKGAEAPELLATRQVQQNGEGGLLGVAVDPDFDKNHFVYAYETKADNRIVRYTYLDGKLEEDKVVLSGIPMAGNHNGGVIKFGPDGYLYAGTGDSQNGDLAANRASLAGKILRMDRDGNPAPGNPFGTCVWTYGHRNVQGLTWTSGGQLFATEHGPSGEQGRCCHDELNRIEKGLNYGWPGAYAGEEKDSLVPAVSHSGDDTWAPSGCHFTGTSKVWANQIVVACLRGQRFERFVLNTGQTAVESRGDTLHEKFGRLRNIIGGPDGSLVFCTSNGDDQILMVTTR